MSEEEYVNKIEKFLLQNDFNVWREVIPDECKNWKNPFRVDLIFRKYGYGYIAVECKLCNTLRAGGKIAAGIEQLKRYRRLTYFEGNKIERWCILLKYNKYNDSMLDTENKGIAEFLKNFLRYYDLSTMWFVEYNNPDCNRISIDHSTKNALHIRNGDEIGKWM